MTDDEQTPNEIEKSDTNSDQSENQTQLTDLSAAHEAPADQAPDGHTGPDGHGAAERNGEAAGQSPSDSDALAPPDLPFETISNTEKPSKRGKAAKGPASPEEKAIKWIEGAAKVVHELPHDPRWPASSGERSLHARLWVVRDNLMTLLGKAPRQFCLTPPGPSAQVLHSLFGEIVKEVSERKGEVQGVTGTWGVWRTGGRERILHRLQTLAETREANLPEPSELFLAGRLSPARVDAGIAAIARELYRHLAGLERDAQASQEF